MQQRGVPTASGLPSTSPLPPGGSHAPQALRHSPSRPLRRAGERARQLSRRSVDSPGPARARARGLGTDRAWGHPGLQGSRCGERAPSGSRCFPASPGRLAYNGEERSGAEGGTGAGLAVTRHPEPSAATQRPDLGRCVPPTPGNMGESRECRGAQSTAAGSQFGAFHFPSSPQSESS